MLPSFRSAFSSLAASATAQQQPHTQTDTLQETSSVPVAAHRPQSLPRLELARFDLDPFQPHPKIYGTNSGLTNSASYDTHHIAKRPRLTPAALHPIDPLPPALKLSYTSLPQSAFDLDNVASDDNDNSKQRHGHLYVSQSSRESPDSLRNLDRDSAASFPKSTTHGPGLSGSTLPSLSASVPTSASLHGEVSFSGMPRYTTYSGHSSFNTSSYVLGDEHVHDSIKSGKLPCIPACNSDNFNHMSKSHCSQTAADSSVPDCLAQHSRRRCTGFRHSDRTDLSAPDNHSAGSRKQLQCTSAKSIIPPSVCHSSSPLSHEQASLNILQTSSGASAEFLVTDSRPVSSHIPSRATRRKVIGLTPEQPAAISHPGYLDNNGGTLESSAHFSESRMSNLASLVGQPNTPCHAGDNFTLGCTSHREGAIGRHSPEIMTNRSTYRKEILDRISPRLTQGCSSDQEQKHSACREVGSVGAASSIQNMGRSSAGSPVFVDELLDPTQATKFEGRTGDVIAKSNDLDKSSATRMPISSSSPQQPHVQSMWAEQQKTRRRIEEQEQELERQRELLRMQTESCFRVEQAHRFCQEPCERVSPLARGHAQPTEGSEVCHGASAAFGSRSDVGDHFTHAHMQHETDYPSIVEQTGDEAGHSPCDKNNGTGLEPRPQRISRKRANRLARKAVKLDFPADGNKRSWSSYRGDILGKPVEHSRGADYHHEEHGVGLRDLVVSGNERICGSQSERNDAPYQSFVPRAISWSRDIGDKDRRSMMSRPTGYAAHTTIAGFPTVSRNAQDFEISWKQPDEGERLSVVHGDSCKEQGRTCMGIASNRNLTQKLDNNGNVVCDSKIYTGPVSPHCNPPINEVKSDGSVECNVCHQRLMNQVTLQNHIRVVHDRSGDHVCKECNARFMWKSTLGNHVRLVHEKDRPYGCTRCDLRFRWKSHLNEHIWVVHEKQQPFICDICGKSFGRKNNMQKHMRRLHPNDASTLHHPPDPFLLQDVAQSQPRSEFEQTRQCPQQYSPLDRQHYQS